jgi:hypothetical protein
MAGGAPRFVVFNAATGKGQPVRCPDGWLCQPLKRPEDLLLISRRGRVGFRRAGGKVTEVLSGKGPFRTSAVADDFSSFAGLDTLGRLWLQKGVQGKPSLLGKASEGQVFWGRVSRRFAWNDGKQGHVYNGETEKTEALSTIQAGWWSPRESRFLYLTGEKEPLLRIWEPGSSREVLSMKLLGSLGAPAFTENERDVFLIAAPDLESSVWAITLE